MEVLSVSVGDHRRGSSPPANAAAVVTTWRCSTSTSMPTRPPHASLPLIDVGSVTEPRHLNSY